MGAPCTKDGRRRRRNQIESALSRAGDRTARDLVKTIGLLGLVGSKHGVETTPGLAALCLGEGVDAAANAFANKSVIVYRKFAQSDRLWDGSDIDIEERLDAHERRLVNHGQGAPCVSADSSRTDILAWIPRLAPISIH